MRGSDGGKGRYGRIWSEGLRDGGKAAGGR